MKSLIIFLALATTVCGFTQGLRVKYGSGTTADKDYFYNVPRTISEIKSLGWRETKGPAGPLPHLKLYCPPGRIVCAFYHRLTGFLSGVQIAMLTDRLVGHLMISDHHCHAVSHFCFEKFPPATLFRAKNMLPVDQYQWAVMKPEKNFVLWHAAENDDEPATDYWTISQYYVAPGTNGPTNENGATLQQGNIWLVGPDGKLMKIPENEAELKTTKYKKQNCIPNMGIHYFYNMSPELKCDEVYPWFLLVKDGKVIGVGFMAYGKVNKLRYQPVSARDWFETYDDPKITFKTVIPDSPACLTDNMGEFGSIFMHVYFINEPWTITCSAEDLKRS